MDIAKLVAKLELQSSQFQSELEKTNRKLLGFQAQSSKALTGIERQAKSFGRALTSAFAGISLATLAGNIKAAIQLGDEIGKAAVKAGIGATAMSELAFAARMADIDISNLSNALRFMQVSLSKAKTGGKEQVEVLAALGLELRSLQSLSPERQFEEFADAIASLRDQEDKARAVTAIFGRAGADLLPMFSEGAEGIRKARDEAKKFGASFSEDVIQTLQEGDEAFKKIGVGWDVLWARIAVGAVNYGQAVAGATDRLKEFATQQGTFARIVRLGSSMLPGIGSLGLAAEFQAQSDALNSYTRGGGSRRGRSRGGAAAPGFGAAGPAPMQDAFTREMRESIAQAQRWQDLIDDIDSGVAESFVDSNNAIEDSFRDMREPIIEVNDQLSVFAEEGARNMQDHFAQFLFDPFDDGLKGMLKGFVDVIRRMVAEAASAQIFESLFGSGSNLFGSFLSGMFGSTATASAGSTGGGWSGPRYADGTSFVPHDQLAMVHRGEAIIPARFNKGGMGGVNITTNIDARGATQDAIKALPEVLKRNNEALEARIVQRLRSGKYG